MSVLETTPPPKCYPKLSCCCADRKQAKNKNLCVIFFGGDVTIWMYSPPLYVTLCLSLFLGSPLPILWWRHFWMVSKLLIRINGTFQADYAAHRKQKQPFADVFQNSCSSIFTGKHLCWSIFLIKLQAFIEHLVWLLLGKVV